MQKVEESCSIECTSTEVIIHELRLRDKEVVKLLQDCGDQASLQEEIEQAIKVGLLVTRNGKTIENVDYVEKNFTNFSYLIKEQIEGMKENVQEYFGPRGLVALLFDISNRNGLATKLLEEINRQIQTLLSASSDQSSLGMLRRELDDNFSKLFGSMNQLLGKTVEAEKGSQKGIVFEEDLYKFLISNTRMTGDSIERTGTKASGRDKKGDLLVTLQNTGLAEELRIVIEAKDTSSISLEGPNGLITQVEQGMVNRNADFGIGVVKNIESLPKYNGALHYYPDKNLIICGFGDDGLAFELAYIFARTILLQGNKVDVETEDIDIERLESVFNEINNKLKMFRSLKKNMTEIEKLTNQTKTDLISFESEIKDLVEDGLNLLNTEP